MSCAWHQATETHWGKQLLLGFCVDSKPMIGCKKGEISSQDKA